MKMKRIVFLSALLLAQVFVVKAQEFGDNEFAKNYIALLESNKQEIANILWQNSIRLNVTYEPKSREIYRVYTFYKWETTDVGLTIFRNSQIAAIINEHFSMDSSGNSLDTFCNEMEESNTKICDEIHFAGIKEYKKLDPISGADIRAVAWKPAFEECLQKAKQGNPEWQNRLGYYYSHGYGIYKDIQQAIYWYKIAANNGVESAKFDLGLIYNNQDNCSEAVFWFKKFIENNNTKIDEASIKMLQLSYQKLGYYYLYGKGIAKDRNEGFRYLQKAVELGDVMANLYLAQCYMYGWGCELDYTKALEYSKVAHDKFPWIASSLILSICYLEGYGCDVDYSKVLDLLKEYSDDTGCKIMIGITYYRDTSIDQNYQKAFECFNSLKEDDNKYTKGQALYWLYKCYVNGNGVAKDIYMSKKCLEESVALGITDAIATLGELYYKGGIYNKDYTLAYKYVKQAAEDNEHPNGKAMRLLSACYRYGLGGCPKDLQKEKFWMENAAKYRDENAVLILNF